MPKTKLLIFLTLGAFYKVQSAHILGIWPVPAKSHYFLGNSLLHGLAEAGHDVTMISPFKNQEATKGGSYTDIYLDGIYDEYLDLSRRLNYTDEKKDENYVIAAIRFQKIIEYFLEREMEHPEVAKVLKSNVTFDVVIFEYFGNDALTLLTSKFNAPIIAFSSTPTSSWINDLVGNPSPLSYIPQVRGQTFSKMNLFDKLQNTYIYVVDKILKFGYFLPTQEKLARKYLPETPAIEKAYTNISLALLYSHESYSQSVPFVPNMIQVGGFHIRPPRKLPTDLQLFLDDAEDGAIYFNLGTNVNLTDMPPSNRDAMLKTFSRLKQRVIMKWEDDSLPGKPGNVITAKWLPQNDILGHPNVRLFITHGGMLSTTEAVYHAIPTLAMPIFGDQFLNSKNAESLGYSLTIPYKDSNFTERKLYQLINELLTNPKYKENVKRRSKLFHDRPMSPMRTAVYWIEYIIRHNGAPHLRVLGRDLPWYQYFMLDVVAFILILVCLGIKLLHVFTSVIFKKRMKLLNMKHKTKHL